MRSKRLFSELWDKRTPLRLLGVSLTAVTRDESEQLSLFRDERSDRAKKVDKAVDAIRKKYGSDTIVRAASIQTSQRVGRKHKAQIEE